MNWNFWTWWWFGCYVAMTILFFSLSRMAKQLDATHKAFEADLKKEIRSLATEIHVLTQDDSITCPVCNMTSHHPVDVQQGYCGNCHSYTSARRFN